MSEQTQPGAGSLPELPDEFPEPTLMQHLFQIAQQVEIALGEAANPVTGKKEPHLPFARYLIDTLALLEEKTRGNRSEDEERYLPALVTQLRLRYVQRADAEGH